MNTFFIRLIKYKTEQLPSTLKYSLDLWQGTPRNIFLLNDSLRMQVL